MRHACCCYVLKFRPGQPALILGVKHPKYQAWTLPGGKVEEGESLADCAARELHEETGLVAGAMMHFYQAEGSLDPSVIVHVFVVGTEGIPQTKDAGEVGWITADLLCASKEFGPFYREFFRWLSTR